MRDALDETFERVATELLDIDFIRKWKSPETHLDEVLRAASHPLLKWLTRAAVKIVDAEHLLPLIVSKLEAPGDPAEDKYVQAAYEESTRRGHEDIRFISFGHTHFPLQCPLYVSNGKEMIYINTGTWRNRICKTVAPGRVPDFIDLQQMTYAIFYGRKEDATKEKGTVSFDVWTGTRKKKYAAPSQV